MTTPQPAGDLGQLILTLRGQRVILDADLAALYGVPTKALNQAVKRNQERFPESFQFEISAEELESMRSQNVTASPKRNARFLPRAFTEHGALMAANVLNSPQAIKMSVALIETFIRLRQALATTQVLARRLAEIERTVVQHDSALKELSAPLNLSCFLHRSHRVGRLVFDIANCDLKLSDRREADTTEMPTKSGRRRRQRPTGALIPAF